MRSTSATSLRKDLFEVIKEAVRSIPTRIRHKKGDAVILSYRQYLALKGRKYRKGAGSLSLLKPMIKGRIKGALNERSEEKLLRYMGLK